MDINSHIEPFINYLRNVGRSESTIIAYKKDIEQLTKYLQNKPITKTTTKDLKQYVKYLVNNKGFTKKTASRKINSLKTFFRYLTEAGKLTVDISLPVKHPEIENKPSRTLSPLEYKAIRDTARRNIRLYTMIELLLQTGIRIGELSRLKIEDIKLHNGIRRLIIREYESNEMRIVELNDIIAEALQNYLQKRKKVQNDQGYLFTTRTGRNVLVRNIRTAVNRVFQKAGVQNARVNDLRNTFICHQIEQGMDIDKLAEIVGHKRISSTEKYLSLLGKKTSGNNKVITPL